MLILLVFAFPFMVQAAAESGSGALSLDDAVRIGLERSRTLEIARLDRDMAHQKIRETWSGVLPQITSSFTYTRTLKPSVLFLPFIPSGVTEASSDNAGHASLDVRQPLFNLSAIAGIKAAGIVRRLKVGDYGCGTDYQHR